MPLKFVAHGDSKSVAHLFLTVLSITPLIVAVSLASHMLFSHLSLLTEILFSDDLDDAVDVFKSTKKTRWTRIDDIYL